MKSKLLKYTEDMARALSKGAHRLEMNQNEFVMRAIIEKLEALNDNAIDVLLAGEKTSLEEADASRNKTQAFS